MELFGTMLIIICLCSISNFISNNYSFWGDNALFVANVIWWGAETWDVFHQISFLSPLFLQFWSGFVSLGEQFLCSHNLSVVVCLIRITAKRIYISCIFQAISYSWHYEDCTEICLKGYVLMINKARMLKFNCVLSRSYFDKVFLVEEDTDSLKLGWKTEHLLTCIRTLFKGLFWGVQYLSHLQITPCQLHMGCSTVDNGFFRLKWFAIILFTYCSFILSLIGSNTLKNSR